jgi:hypothetical protein
LVGGTYGERMMLIEWTTGKLSDGETGEYVTDGDEVESVTVKIKSMV